MCRGAAAAARKRRAPTCRCCETRHATLAARGSTYFILLCDASTRSGREAAPPRPCGKVSKGSRHLTVSAVRRPLLRVPTVISGWQSRLAMARKAPPSKVPLGVHRLIGAPGRSYRCPQIAGMRASAAGRLNFAVALLCCSPPGHSRQVAARRSCQPISSVFPFHLAVQT